MKPVSLPQISILNRQRRIDFDLLGLEAFARHALPLCAAEEGIGLTSLSEINVVLVSDRKIADLHHRFLKIAGPTDVITFQHGEIFISAETAQRQARHYRTSLGHELRLYLVHGLLHLHGFDDQTAASRARMSHIQEGIVARLQESNC
ncbi:MAG TPA: rRNA maturation RNase YbeY [Chthoniobacterales bacterium]|jgi:probable rRNA maturation factor